MLLIAIGMMYENTNRYLKCCDKDLKAMIELFPQVHTALITDYTWEYENRYEGDWYKVADARSLSQALASILKDSKEKQIIIYYTGHASPGSITLPVDYLPFDDIRNLINAYTDPWSEILILLDCCYPSNLNLPYKFNGKTFKLDRPELAIYSTQRILLMTSASDSERSHIDNDISIFTNSFTKVLTDLFKKESMYDHYLTNDVNRNLQRLRNRIFKKLAKNTNLIQDVSIYSSHLFDPVLWWWVGLNRCVVSQSSSLKTLNFFETP